MGGYDIRPLLFRCFFACGAPSEVIRPSFRIKAIIRHIALLPHAAERRNSCPYHRGQTNNRQIQRTEYQRLDRMPIFMRKNASCSALVQPVRQKHEHSQRYTAAVAPFRHHRSVIKTVRSFYEHEKYQCPCKTLDRSPATLPQDIEKSSHFSSL